MTDTERAAWKVDFTVPQSSPEGTQRWTRNLNATVVARDMLRVIAVVLKAYPTCTLVAIHRIGSERLVMVDAEDNQ